MGIISYKGKRPVIGKDCFIADTATLAGDVTLCDKVSVWYSAVIRSEAAPIEIGSESNIQDNCTIHTDEGFPTTLGDQVTVGHGAIIHGSQIGSKTLVGMGTIIMNGSTIGKNCLIGGGSLILQGTTIEDGMLVLGSPAKVKRKLTEEEISKIGLNVTHYNTFRTEYLLK